MYSFRERLESLKKRGLLRKIRDREGPQGRVITIKGRSLINFSSNDYLGLCNHPSIKNAVTRALSHYGTGAGASRLLSGGTILHEELEALISNFKETEATVIYTSGYTANIGTITALTEKDWLILSDELNHASIVDGCRLSRAEVVIYRHKDTEHLEEILKKERTRPKMIVTDSVFSMDGDIAPVDQIKKLAERYNALLYIDEAHATGVLGEGRGSLKQFGLSSAPFIIQMGTLSKAIGSVGAFITGSSEIVRYLINTSRTLIYTTALPPHDVAAASEAIRIIMDEPERIKRLWENREKTVTGLHSLGIDTGESETPIIPIMVKDNETALRLAEHLIENGIYAPAIRYPTVRSPRIRLTVTASHTEDDIHRLVTVLKEARDCGLL